MCSCFLHIWRSGRPCFVLMPAMVGWPSGENVHWLWSIPEDGWGWTWSSLQAPFRHGCTQVSFWSCTILVCLLKFNLWGLLNTKQENEKIGDILQYGSHEIVREWCTILKYLGHHLEECLCVRDGGFAVRDQLTVRCYDRVGRWHLPELILPRSTHFARFQRRLDPTFLDRFYGLAEDDEGRLVTINENKGGRVREKNDGTKWVSPLFYPSPLLYTFQWSLKNPGSMHSLIKVPKLLGLVSRTCYSSTSPLVLWSKEWNWRMSSQTRRRASAGL